MEVTYSLLPLGEGSGMRGRCFSVGATVCSDEWKFASLPRSSNGAGVAPPHPWPLSPRRGEKWLLPINQRLCVEAFLAGGVQHAVDEGRVWFFLAGEDPEVFAIGRADEGS